MATRTLQIRLLKSFYRAHASQTLQASRAFTTTHPRRGVDQTTNSAAVHIPNLPNRSLKPRRRSSSPTLPTNSTAEVAYPYTDPSAVTSEEVLDDDERSFTEGRTASSIEDTTYFRITLRRSAIGLPERVSALLTTLGLHRRGLTAYHPVTPDVVGKLMRVKELIAVEEVPFDKLPPGADEIVRLTHFTDAPLRTSKSYTQTATTLGANGALSKTELKARLAEIMSRHLGSPSFPGGSANQSLDAETAEMVDIWVADAQARDRHAPPVLGPARLIAKLEEAEKMRRRSADIGFFVEQRAGDALKA